LLRRTLVEPENSTFAGEGSRAEIAEPGTLGALPGPAIFRLSKKLENSSYSI
jgi:hypothetical protein